MGDLQDILDGENANGQGNNGNAGGNNGGENPNVMNMSWMEIAGYDRKNICGVLVQKPAGHVRHNTMFGYVAAAIIRGLSPLLTADIPMSEFRIAFRDTFPHQKFVVNNFIPIIDLIQTDLATLTVSTPMGDYQLRFEEYTLELHNRNGPPEDRNLWFQIPRPTLNTMPVVVFSLNTSRATL